MFVGVDQDQFSQEMQLAYTGDRLTAVAGVYYLKENVESHQEAYADDLLGPLFLNSGFLRTVDDDLSTKSYAAYANASYEIAPTVRLSAGLRYTKETKDYFRTTSTFFSLLPAFNSTFAFVPPQGKWNDTSPMVSLDWQATPSTMVYARVAKGFKSGGFNGRANTVAESTKYDPETVWSYEAGFKTTVASQLKLNGAVFYNDYKDFQARVSGIDDDPVTGLPSPKLSVLNAGKMRIKGAELEVAWTPVRNLLVDAQLGYLNADYKDFDDVRFTAFGGSRAFQTPAFAPKWTLRLGGQYTFDLGRSRRNHRRWPDALSLAPGPGRRQHDREHRHRSRRPVPGRLLDPGRADRLGAFVEEVLARPLRLQSGRQGLQDRRAGILERRQHPHRLLRRAADVHGEAHGPLLIDRLAAGLVASPPPCERRPQ